VTVAALPGLGALYLAADIALSAWMLRADLRRRGRAAVVASLELVGGVCLSIPAMAYLDTHFAAAIAPTLLRILFIIGLPAVLWFGWRALRSGLRDPAQSRLPPRQRWLLLALGPGMALIASAPEIWWASLALQ
jgi:arginine exporter protein ArgO